MTDEFVVVIDQRDCSLGAMEKMEADSRGALHRTVSVILHNGSGDLLMQKRARGKCRSPELWSNMSCWDPRPGESVLEAATRRLPEEMGLVCALSPLLVLRYQADVPPRLIDNELVHLFIRPCEAHACAQSARGGRLALHAPRRATPGHCRRRRRLYRVVQDLLGKSTPALAAACHGGGFRSQYPKWRA